MESKVEKRKKRKRKRRIFAIILSLCIVAMGMAGLFFWKQSKAEDITAEIVAGEGEELQYARINNIVGNEIEVSLLLPEEENMQPTEAEEETFVGGQEAQEKNETNGSLETVSDNSAVLNGISSNELQVSGNIEPGAEEGESGKDTFTDPEFQEGTFQEDTSQDSVLQNGAPQDISSRGSAPRGSAPRGSAPQGSAPQGSSFQEGAMQGAAASSGPGGESIASYTETGESASYQIPVGTDVITQLGVTTTFSRLAAGDVIALLLEEGTDNILKIWIVQ